MQRRTSAAFQRYWRAAVNRVAEEAISLPRSRRYEETVSLRHTRTVTGEGFTNMSFLSERKSLRRGVHNRPTRRRSTRRRN